MAPSAPSPRIGRGSADSALTLKNQLASPDDSRPARCLPVAGDGARTGDNHREVSEAARRVETLDDRWQSLIDAATD